MNNNKRVQLTLTVDLVHTPVIVFRHLEDARVNLQNMPRTIVEAIKEEREDLLHERIDLYISNLTNLISALEDARNIGLGYIRAMQEKEEENVDEGSGSDS